MERVIDLDLAVAEITRRQGVWESRGVRAAPVTWRDRLAAWPQELETDRSRVHDPDSIGTRLVGPDDAELVVVLFQGGWADVDYVVSADDAGPLPARGVTSVKAFGELLDRCVTRVFGPASA